MKVGKQKCRILKEIRQQIADENEIKLVTSICKHRGDCLGTCPKCEDEVRYLEQQLLLRQKAGLCVKLVGISLGLTVLTPTALYGQENMKTDLIECHDTIPEIEVVRNIPVRKGITIVAGLASMGVKITGIWVEGIVVDARGNPVTGASVTEKGTLHKVITDKNGHFEFRADKKRPVLIVRYDGLRTKKVRVKVKRAKNISVVMHKAWFMRKKKE